MTHQLTADAKAGTKPSAANNKAGYCYKLFRVKRADNCVTTVSMDPALATIACRHLGGLSKVSMLVRELSLAFDAQPEPGRNRSRFVSTSLMQEVARAKTQAAKPAEAVTA